MINGDVDLTENLDFLRDKKPKELPSVVPWDKKLPKRQGNMLELLPTEIQNFVITSTVNNSINNEFFLSLSNNTSTTNSYSLNYNGLELNNSNYISLSNNYSSTSTNNSIGTSVSNSTLLSSHNLTIPYSSNNITTTSNRTIGITKVDDLFPWKQKRKKRIHNIHFRGKLIICKGNNPLPLFFKSHRRMKSLVDNEDYIFNETIRIQKKMIKIEDNKIKIPWLKKMNYQDYRNYINDLFEDDSKREDKDLKYLTDYSWLGIYNI